MSLAWLVTKNRHLVEWRGKWKVNQYEKSASSVYLQSEKKIIAYFKGCSLYRQCLGLGMACYPAVSAARLFPEPILNWQNSVMTSSTLWFIHFSQLIRTLRQRSSQRSARSIYQEQLSKKRQADEQAARQMNKNVQALKWVCAQVKGCHTHLPESLRLYFRPNHRLSGPIQKSSSAQVILYNCVCTGTERKISSQVA